ncbi:MAG: hypothetical protein IT462_04725 [Planctomycetes bacterium]|nr:hypothetical protein [Planctomycetota bacterium]
MWIKRLLVIIPVVILVFLAQSVFWVPNTNAVSDNEARLNRLVLYMTANPEDMNPWKSTATTDSTISDYFFEGLVRYNQNYEIEPHLAHTVAVTEDIVTLAPGDMPVADFEKRVREQYGDLVADFRVEDAGKAVHFNPSSGAVIEARGAATTLSVGAMPRVRVSFKPAYKKGSITSAVQPEFEAQMSKRLGREIYSEIAPAALAAQALKLRPEAERTKENEKLLLAEFTKWRQGVSAIAHSPIVDFIITKGMRWTDGPFFADDIKKREGLAKLDPATGKGDWFGEDSGPFWIKGPEFTSKDCKITFDLLRDKDFASPRASSYESIVETRTFADDPYRFQVVYGELYSPALSDLTGGLLPYHVWNDEAWLAEAIRKGRGPKDVGVAPEAYNVKRFLAAQERDFRLKPSSMGPMVLEPLNGKLVPMWKLGYQIRLRRNEFYWERKPEYQFVDYYVFEPAHGSETVEFAFTTGSLDTYGARAFQVQRYEELDDRYYVIKRQLNQYEYIGFNCSVEHLKDPRVRLALSMAVDVDSIIDKIHYGQASRVAGPTYPVLPYYNKDFTFKHRWLTKNKNGERAKAGEMFAEGDRAEEDLKFVPFDMQEARAILIDSGCKDEGGRLVRGGQPFKVFLVSVTGPNPRRDVAVLAKERWNALGIEVEYQEHEWNTYLTQYVKAGKYDICVLGWSGGLDFDIRQLWGTNSRPPQGLNYGGYSNKKADELMEKILSVYDPAEQIRMSHEIFDTIAADFPYVFLFSPYTTTVLDKHIVWRKPVTKDGKDWYEDRPVNHKTLREARAPIRYYLGELLRRDEYPKFNPGDIDN